MNDLHAMDTLHEHIALVMVLYCIDYSAKLISMVIFYTVSFNNDSYMA